MQTSIGKVVRTEDLTTAYYMVSNSVTMCKDGSGLFHILRGWGVLVAGLRKWKEGSALLSLASVFGYAVVSGELR
jgi:hypothetical protein